MQFSKPLAKEINRLMPVTENLGLLGTHNIRIDEKWRFKLPEDLKFRLNGDAEQEFVMSLEESKKGKRYLLLQPHSQWAPLFQVLSILQNDKTFTTEIFTILASIKLTKLDSTTRILIPSDFREELSLNGRSLYCTWLQKQIYIGEEEIKKVLSQK